MEMPDIIYAGKPDATDENCGKTSWFYEYERELDPLLLLRNNASENKYYHSRIVEALRQENEELREKLKPHPKCDSGCMFLCEVKAKLMKVENEELKAAVNILEQKLRDVNKAHDRAEAKLDKAKDALTDIAQFYDGEIVTGSFDEPHAAKRARTTLEEIG